MKEKPNIRGSPSNAVSAKNAAQPGTVDSTVFLGMDKTQLIVVCSLIVLTITTLYVGKKINSNSEGRDANDKIDLDIEEEDGDVTDTVELPENPDDNLEMDEAVLNSGVFAK